MSLILNRGLSTQYTFPNSFSMDPPPWSIRTDEMERAYKHGSVITGDEMIKSRMLRIWGTMFYTTRAAFANALDSMTEACYRPDLTFHSTEHYSDRFLYLDRISNFSYDNLVTLLGADFDILFKVTDPFWYSDTQAEDAQTNLRTADIITLSNGGQIEVSPTIDVWCVSGTVASMTMMNDDDADRSFTYSRTLTSGRGFRVRASEGGVWYWNGSSHSEDIINFDGTFYRLVPGTNRIVLTIEGGGRVDVTHFWRIKWLG